MKLGLLAAMATADDVPSGKNSLGKDYDDDQGIEVDQRISSPMLS